MIGELIGAEASAPITERVWAHPKHKIAGVVTREYRVRSCFPARSSSPRPPRLRVVRAVSHLLARPRHRRRYPRLRPHVRHVGDAELRD